MSLYLNTVTNEYPLYIGDLELVGWKEGETLPEEIVEVEDIALPEVKDTNKKIVEEFPENVDGLWKRKFTLVELTSEEKKEISKPVVTPNQTCEWNEDTSSWTILEQR